MDVCARIIALPVFLGAHHSMCCVHAGSVCRLLRPALKQHPSPAPVKKRVCAA